MSVLGILNYDDMGCSMVKISTLSGSFWNQVYEIYENNPRENAKEYCNAKTYNIYVNKLFSHLFIKIESADDFEV